MEVELEMEDRLLEPVFSIQSLQKNLVPIRVAMVWQVLCKALKKNLRYDRFHSCLKIILSICECSSHFLIHFQEGERIAKAAEAEEQQLSSLVWICTSTHKMSRVTVVDANNPADVLKAFNVCQSHLLCIASVPGMCPNIFDDLCLPPLAICTVQLKILFYMLVRCSRE